MLEKLFHLQESGTTVRREVVAGCTTFMTLSYIIFVQPAVLSAAGMDAGAMMAAHLSGSVRYGWNADWCQPTSRFDGRWQTAEGTAGPVF
ncbi:MAG: hypothetical protein F4Z85_06050 [Gemmatimonadetes bacterium]|nr:hypothetical protein [Gemmatimonadota bacterium]MYB67808.1 hypothetical protein [Gemmatimonadota bacterium]